VSSNNKKQQPEDQKKHPSQCPCADCKAKIKHKHKDHDEDDEEDYYPTYKKPSKLVSHKNSNSITLGIIRKWNKQKVFYHYVDNNYKNIDITNISKISLKKALENMEYRVDWDLNLTPLEIQFVKNEEWRRRLIFL